MEALLRGEDVPTRYEMKIVTKSGGTRWGELVVKCIQFESQKCIMGTFVDLTERHAASSHLQLAASVFKHAREGIMITDTSGTIVDVNSTFAKMSGYTRDELVGVNPRILNSSRHSRDFFSTMWTELHDYGYWTGEIWNRRKDGDLYAQMLTISAVVEDDSMAHHYVALCTDITAIKEQQHTLERIAHYDALTALPNRVLLADRLHQAMTSCQRQSRFAAVAYLDLDGFKAVNDTYGHAAGDQLLITVSRRMKAVMREGDTLARIGGDEFVAVLANLDHQDSYIPIVERMLAAASEPTEVVPNQEKQVSASIGLTVYPWDDSDPDRLLRHADQAMYVAKQGGKNQYHLFDIAQDAEIQILQQTIEEVLRAFEHNEFVLYYQPKVNLHTSEVTGVEALIRWNHPTKGMQLPAAFLPALQGHSLSNDLGEWVIFTALTQILAWQNLGLRVPVSVNIDATQLQKPGFAAELSATLGAFSLLHAGLLELEILETSALADIEQVSQAMRECQKLGVQFALDDFGTGYSSLTYLKRLPAEYLKIDRSFVRDMLDDANDLAIIQGIIGLTSAFGRHAIAEGVETQQHSDLLLAMGCHMAQGFFIAQPMPAEQFPAWLAEWNLNHGLPVPQTVRRGTAPA